jgi:hypothetical protein
LDGVNVPCCTGQFGVSVACHRGRLACKTLLGFTETFAWRFTGFRGLQRELFYVTHFRTRPQCLTPFAGFCGAAPASGSCGTAGTSAPQCTLLIRQVGHCVYSHSHSVVTLSRRQLRSDIR